MKKSSFVHAYWNSSSQGSFFDFGIAFMANKRPWHILNMGDYEEKELEPIDRFIAINALINSVEPNRESLEITRTYDDWIDWLNNKKTIEYQFEGLDKRKLFELGMIFMADKPLILKNRDYLQTLRTPTKSFQNVLLELDSRSC